MRSIPRFASRSRSGSESEGRSASPLLGFCRGRPLGRGTLTSASVASASVTSPGEALSSRTPSGRPPPSTSTTHFVPLPRLVLPTAEPLFSPERSCRPETSLPTAAGLLHRARPAALAKRRATHPALPTASTAASRSQATHTCRARTATPRRSVTPTKCPPDRPGWRPKDGLACPCAASVQATTARSTPTALHSTTQTASCSCKKSIKPPTLCRVSNLRPNLFMKHALASFGSRFDPLVEFLLDFGI